MFLIIYPIFYHLFSLSVNRWPMNLKFNSFQFRTKRKLKSKIHIKKCVVWFKKVEFQNLFENKENKTLWSKLKRLGTSNFSAEGGRPWRFIRRTGIESSKWPRSFRITVRSEEKVARTSSLPKKQWLDSQKRALRDERPADNEMSLCFTRILISLITKTINNDCFCGPSYSARNRYFTGTSCLSNSKNMWKTSANV